MVEAGEDAKCQSQGSSSPGSWRLYLEGSHQKHLQWDLSTRPIDAKASSAVRLVSICKPSFL